MYINLHLTFSCLCAKYAHAPTKLIVFTQPLLRVDQLQSYKKLQKQGRSELTDSVKFFSAINVSLVCPTSTCGDPVPDTVCVLLGLMTITKNLAVFFPWLSYLYSLATVHSVCVHEHMYESALVYVCCQTNGCPCVD